MSAENIPTPAETQRDWFMRRLVESRLDKPAPKGEQYFPTACSARDERLVGVASTRVRNMYALKEETKHRGKLLDPALPDYDAQLTENMYLYKVATEAYEIELRGQFFMSAGRRLRVVRRFEVVASPDPSEEKLAPVTPGIEDALSSIMSIVHHYGVVRDVLGPEIARILAHLRGTGK